jgi:hypothetical protein
VFVGDADIYDDEPMLDESLNDNSFYDYSYNK